METAPRLSLLTATHGRFNCLRRLLAMMMAQDCKDFEWIVLNNHPTPITCNLDLPWLKIVNLSPQVSTLGECRNILLGMARGKHMMVVDDDDSYLPWYASTGLDNIGDSPAWKPARSWWQCGYDFTTGPKFELCANALEASIIWKTHFVKSIGFHTGNGDEWKFLHQAMHNGCLQERDLGHWAPYVYGWNDFMHHASGTIGNGQSDDDRAAAWKKANQDVSTDALTPDYVGVLAKWRSLVKCVDPRLQTAWMLAVIGHGPAHVKPLPDCSGKFLNSGQCAKLCAHKRCVVAPGAWDLLHDGHKETLTWARSQGEVLIALTNSSEAISGAKGPTRPLVPLDGRKASLAALDVVDYIASIDQIDDRPFLSSIGGNVVVAKGHEFAGTTLLAEHYAGFDVRIAPPSPHARHTTDLVASYVGDVCLPFSK